MLYKFRNKKGNVTIILIGIISVMILMTMALSKRMTSHTQLLMLSDYTQISRYFLESYVGDVMQNMRYEITNPDSALSQEIYKDIDNIKEQELRDKFYKNPSPKLKELATELKIDCDYKPEVKIVDPESYINDNPDDPNTSTNEGDGNLKYPDGIDPGKNLGKEKKGLIRIICKCKFNNRDYKLEVKYPFSVVFRMTPVIKDFMLFVENMNEEQKDTEDGINILLAEETKYSDTLRKGTYGLTGGAKPFILLQPLDQYKYNNPGASGKVYLGASDKPVYINLAGGSYTSDINETFLLSTKDLGIATKAQILDLVPFLPLPTDRYNGKWLSLPGTAVPIKNSQEAKMSAMGFSSMVEDAFLDSGSSWHLDHFIKDSDDWKLVKAGESSLSKALSYASALKLYGLNGDIAVREIYGNVFARYLILTFWYPNRTVVSGEPLYYDKNRSIDQIPQKLMLRVQGENRYIKFEPLDEENDYYDPGVTYKFFMSRIMSGYDWSNYTGSAEDKENDFAPMNIGNDTTQERAILTELEFQPQDGFSIKSSSDFKFNDFGEKWFGYSQTENGDLSPIEERIGRAYSNQDKFFEAVGYDKNASKDSKQNFKVNGVVFVNGDLDLSNGMILDSSSCSGGVVLVNGKITLGNIFRNEKLKPSDFVLVRGSSRPAEDKFREWTNSAKPNYIAADKILTFVSLSGDSIEVVGNVLLGVQLVNDLFKNNRDQIKFDVANKRDGLIFYGSIVCKKLDLVERIKEFSKIDFYDTMANAPFFIYPSVMASETPPLAVQIRENMRGYSLTSSVGADNP